MRDAKVEPRALSAAGPFVAKTVDEVLLKINGFGLYQSLAVLYWIGHMVLDYVRVTLKIAWIGP